MAIPSPTPPENYVAKISHLGRAATHRTPTCLGSRLEFIQSSIPYRIVFHQSPAYYSIRWCCVRRDFDFR